MAYELWDVPLDLETGSMDYWREHGRMPPAGRWPSCHKVDQKYQQSVAVRRGLTVARCWMGVAPGGRSLMWRYIWIGRSM